MAELGEPKKPHRSLEPKGVTPNPQGAELQDNLTAQRNSTAVEGNQEKSQHGLILRGAGASPVQIAQRTSSPSDPGLPDQLAAGIEALSGIAMDHVRVHYSSGKPKQLNAHAYAQGDQVHLAPGQEEHLAHEAWHVVQQAQGRVQPTTQVKGAAVDADIDLEAEANLMGVKANASAE